MRLGSLNPKRSLAGRLAWAVIGAVTIALVVATALSVWREVDRYAADKREALRAVAQVFAHSIAPAAAANDPDAADATLRAIARQRAIVYAALERPDGTTVSEQGIGLRLTEDVDLDAEADIPLFSLVFTRTVRVAVPVVSNAREVGRIVLVAETGDLAQRIAGVALNAALAGLLAIGVGLVVALRLHRAVTRPLASLARTMDAVRLRHDYTQRAAITADDEVGTLAGTFNDLLGAVNERDRKLAEHGAHLEEEVRIRTCDLSEAMLAAEAANTAKSSFLATMSHEIRTPMNGMLVMAELLAGADLPPRQRRYAEVIARSGQSLLAIINDILDFAKVEAGKLDLERVAVSPAEIADTVVTLFGERARTAGLDLAAYVATDVPRTILGDPVRLGQVVSNFVSNALKFTQAGHVLVRIEPCPEDHRFLLIRVTDTGIGIPQDKLSRIFSAFSQADQSTTRRFGGTGLGLSIAQRLIEAMGGTVGVESRTGIGSTFWARIPVEAEAAALPVRRADAVAPGVVLGDLGGATREALAASLTAAGFVLDGAGADAHRIVSAAELAGSRTRPVGAGRVLALCPMGDPTGTQAIRTGLADELLRWPLAQAEWASALAALAGGLPFAGTQAAQGAPAEDLPRFSTARVLVADDSAVNREVAIEALSRCGVTDVVTVEDGAQAVAAAEAGSFDLILMDGSMPVLDGFEAACAIRRREAETGAEPLPIVALTAHVLGEGATAWQAAGMDGVLAKPFTLVQLGQVLAAFLTRSAEAEPVADAQGPRQDEPAPAESADETGPDGLLDLQTLGSLSEMGDAAFFARVVQLYTQQAPAALAALDRAAAETDPQAVARSAHSLKSMSLNIGASALAANLGRIEMEAREAAACPDTGAMGAVGAVFTRTMEALDRYADGVRRAA